jgi:hypothetical protein
MITQPNPAGIDNPIRPSPSSAGEIARWLDARESELTHPSMVEEQLVRAGWHPAQAAAAALQYRRRFNEHALGYSALMVATGLTALAAGTSGHLLVAGLDHPLDRNALAGWLSLLVCSLPFAVWAHRWAARVDRDDHVAAWSRSRRSLAVVLLWACGIVGIGRLFIYAAELMGVLLGATWARGATVAAGAINVAITVSIALPLGLWAFSFLHRFDREDPSVPVPQRRRSGR